MTAPSRGPHPEPPADAEGREPEAAEDRSAAGSGVPGETPAAEGREVRTADPDGAREESAPDAPDVSGSASEGPEASVASEKQPSEPGSEAEPDGSPEDPPAAEGGNSGNGDGGREAGQLSEAQAELAAQRELRAKIAQRKAER
ncbi:DNA helicase RecD, partial [Streptomyces sp. SID5473]|nr:hypothetical protein [Streptomyces tsukubensis NRRL18488]MYS63024.1 DNA helicase RecD [Streptomyces sp. SID5473]